MGEQFFVYGLIAFLCMTACSDNTFNATRDEKERAAAASAAGVAKNAPAFCFEGDVPSDIPQEVAKSLFKIRAERPISVIPSAGRTFYVCDSGDDNADGLSPATAVKSLKKAQSLFNKDLEAGEQLRFCRGGTFVSEEGRMLWVNPRCRADKPCVVSDYTVEGTSGSPRPIFQVGVSGGSLFKFEDSGTPDHEEGYIFKNMDLRGKDYGGNGFFFFNDITDVVIENVRIEGFGIGVQIAGSNKGKDDIAPVNHRITLRYSDIIGNNSQGWLGGSGGTSLINNCFRNNGFEKSIFLHNIYYSGKKDTSGGLIKDNILLDNARVDGSKCEAVSLVVHGIVSDLTIDHNLVYEKPQTAAATCWGIAVDTGYSSAEAFAGLVIKNNWVMNVGNQAIGCTGCSGGSIQANTIIYTDTEMGIGGALAVPNRSPGDGDAITTGMTISDNKFIFNNKKSTVAIKAKNLGDQAFKVSNNVAIYKSELKSDCMRITNDENSVITDAGNNKCLTAE